MDGQTGGTGYPDHDGPIGDTDEETLYGLIEVAERQQDAAQTAIDGLTAERSAFAEERERWGESVDRLNEDIRSTVTNAVTDTLAGAAETGAETVKGATQSLLAMLEQVSKQAADAEATLRGIVEWRWQLLGRLIASVALLAFLWWLASCAVLWWDTGAIGRAQMEKAQLQAQVAELKANYRGWVAAGLSSKLQQCGPKKRPCVQVDENAGVFGDQSDYRIVRGY